ncbi:MAG: hypothetical protein IKC65_09585 [Lentisphaeria bacterium]|nr:hypothetical protein [Lentisphaeria bacterium]
MILLSYADAFFLYLLGWLLVLALLTWRAHLRRKKHYWRVSTGNLFHCDKCHHTFVPQEQLNLCRCPRCNAVCIRKRRRDSE